MRLSILCYAFRKSGVYPLRREQITDDQTRSSLTYSSSCATVTWEVVESNHDARPVHVLEESVSSIQSDQTVFPTQEISQSVSLDANPSPKHEFVTKRVLYGNLAPLPQVRMESTSFDKEPSPLLEDSRYSSQPGQSISLEPSPSVSLESGSIDTATTTFHAIESVLPTPVKAKYRQQDQGYDLQGSPTYQAWKILNEAHNQPQATPSLITHTGDLPPTTSVAHHKTPQATPSPPTRCLLTSPSSLIFPVIQKLLTYPTVEKRVNNNTKHKSVKRAIPLFMNSEAAMKLLFDEKLKNAREVAAKRKKMREKKKRS